MQSGQEHIVLEPGRLHEKKKKKQTKKKQNKKLVMSFWTSPILDFCRLEIENLAMISQDPYFLDQLRTHKTRNWSVLLDESNT